MKRLPSGHNSSGLDRHTSVGQVAIWQIVATPAGASKAKVDALLKVAAEGELAGIEVNLIPVLTG
jgi:hypothetical protein